MIQLNNIQISFNKNSSAIINALNDINLLLHEGEWTYVIGGNGSGKSTLLKLINQEYLPDKGQVTFNSFTPSEVLYIDQVTLKNLVPSMTLYENLIFGLKKPGTTPNLRFYKQRGYRTKMVSVLKEFEIGLENRLNEQVRFLSGGEQQIIVASRIMLSRPKVLLMDEFTSSLDQKWAPFILSKLKQFVTLNNILALAVTHDFDQIQETGDRLIMLKNGMIKADKKKINYDFSTQSILKLFYENH